MGKVKNNWERLFLTIAILAVLFGLLVMGIAVAGPTKANKPECNDGLDNDGDGKIDLADGGCVDKGDRDETNCGDRVCEGGETSSSCVVDCGPANSCSDTDGGFVVSVQGTVSGYQNGQPFSYSDVCLDLIHLKEWSCSGTAPYAFEYGCAVQNYTGCSNGACVA